ncbi:hypothetical protein AYL99_08672 [Fonsecaea erecta]|uniref:Xylanolytic transcriptional activator regulatory domain-containing protein n=1 Tax=Fonsecaea erecta TaxID=1367422 RepID=A0A178ZDQ1_9EURO|nr:hypothetical protein AYL99_08672 [Fonsecaea erecta]OAP57934.1 hypothetical protein AYL99_08672 [Fonsecaea erecta]
MRQQETLLQLLLSKKRQCVYRVQSPKTRLVSIALGKEELADIIRSLKSVSPREATTLLSTITLSDEGTVQQPGSSTNNPSPSATVPKFSPDHSASGEDSRGRNSTDSDTFDMSPFLSLGDQGNLDSFKPSSALQAVTRPPGQALAPDDLAHVQNKLIANAVLSRQREHEIYSCLVEMDGAPVELAIHLLNLHWTRQHHTFLLTYRPVIMPDVLQGGPFASKFLLNAIFACSAKFSTWPEIRDDPNDLLTAGGQYLRRCDELLREGLLVEPSMPIIIGLLLLGSTFNAQGKTSKGWLYTGYALRMLYDLGLQTDRKATFENAEEIELRCRDFWGAFICDKLQSLYMGRPIAIHLRDACVSPQLLDTLKENEPWVRTWITVRPELSKIMTQIINKSYVINAAPSSARASLEGTDTSMGRWKSRLPSEVQFDPLSDFSKSVQCYAPNVLNLHCIYHALVVLLHRPFVAVGHLRAAAGQTNSWKNYALFVACTIHARNAAAFDSTMGFEHSYLLHSSLKCLEDLTIPNAGVSRPINIIRRPMTRMGVSQGTPSVYDSLAISYPSNNVDNAEDQNSASCQAISLLTSTAQNTDTRTNNPQGDPQQRFLTMANWSPSRDMFQNDLLYGFVDENSDHFEMSFTFNCRGNPTTK